MASIGKYEFTYNPQGRPPHPNATDLHLKAAGRGKTTIISVDKVGTEDPNAMFNVEGQDEAEVDITAINVALSGTLAVRIKHSANRLPRYSYYWTDAGRKIPGDLTADPRR